LVGYTLWNYNPLNTWETGDLWNGEDFSIFTQSAIQEACAVLHEVAIKANAEEHEDDSANSPVAAELERQLSGTPHTPFDLSQLNYDPPNEKTHVGGRYSRLIKCFGRSYSTICY
jgi:hypothetical protein